MLRRALGPLAAALAVTVASFSAQAQSAFPDTSKTIRLIIPNSTGGGTDIAGRMLADGLKQKLGTAVVVENLSGAGGIEGATTLMNAAPDGYTLALIPVPQVSMYYLDPERGGSFKREAADTVAQHDYGAIAIAVAADSPYKTLDDVIKATKEKPGSITSASSSVLAAGHLALLRLNKVAGINLNWTAMEQQGTALSSLLGGHINVITDTFSELYPHAQSGAVRILAVFDEQRPELMPDVPTAPELGYDAVLRTTRFVIVPAGTPKEVIETLEGAIQELIADPAYQELAKQRQVGISFRNAEEAAQVWSQIDEDFGPIVKEFRSQ